MLWLALLAVALSALNFFILVGSFCFTHFWHVWTVPRDLSALLRFTRVRRAIRQAERDDASFPSLFQKVAERKRDKVAFYCGEQVWTFAQVDKYSNRLAHVFCSRRSGVVRGDVVCVFMRNSVELVCTWLGLSKIGVIPALIGSQLRDASLQHCIAEVSCKAIICSADLQEVLHSVRHQEGVAGIHVFVSGAKGESLTLEGAVDLDGLVSATSPRVPSQLGEVGYRAPLLYIFTSGTTGMPKAARLLNSRAIFVVYGIHYMMQIREEDVVYAPLPLSHTSAGLLGVGQALLFGCPTIIRDKLSVSSYWRDTLRYKATVGMYIGEVCSYLLAAPHTPEEQQHQVRMMFGNGLRPDMWKDFKKRFCIRQIREFYGSTEGNASLVNTNGKTGAVGFISLVLPLYYPVALLHCDLITGQLTRNSRGLCVRCQPGETGQLVGKISQGDPTREFEGYLGRADTQNTVVHDVFRKGDHGFLTGDLLTMDKKGYLYFQDRLGDTFRWKGENVSTTEVERVITALVGNLDLVVYGVKVEGQEGRAGMATIVDPSNSLDMDGLATHLLASLPPYAVPLFLRVTSSNLQKTETQKVKKNILQEEGFNPNKIEDDLYFLDMQRVKYVPLGADLYLKITKGKVTL